MARKKKDEVEETADQPIAGAADESAIEAAPAEDNAGVAAADAGEGTSVVETIVDAAAGALETVATAVGKGAADLVNAIAGPVEASTKHSKRAERVGIVASDKMTK